VLKLRDTDKTQVANALEGLAATIRETGEVPSTSFQINTTGVRIELKLVQLAGIVYNCGNCRGFRRGQGVVGYCDDPRSPRTDQVTEAEYRPCQSYERVTNGE